MQRLVPIIVGAVILIASATAYGVPITVHEKMRVQREVVDYERVRGDAFVTPKTIMVTRVVEDVIHVPPRDRDDDGIADKEDDCVFCDPVYVRESGTGGYSGTGMTSSPVDGYYGTGDAIPSYITQCESGGDYGAYNPSSGATGAYQIIPSTAAAYGCDLSYPAGQDACAAEIYADVGASAWDCG